MRNYLLLLLLIGFPSLGAAQQVALKTNTLFWLTGTPNVGTEIGVGSRVTFGLWGAYNA